MERALDGDIAGRTITSKGTFWEQLQLLPGWVDDQVGDHVRALKSTYIDAQLGKMYAKIEELSGRSMVASVKSTTTSSTPSTPVISVVSEKASSVVESVISKPG